MGNSRSKREDSKYDDEDLSYEEDENALQYLELHLTRLIAYAESADASLQRERRSIWLSAADRVPNAIPR